MARFRCVVPLFQAISFLPIPEIAPKKTEMPLAIEGVQAIINSRTERRSLGTDASTLQTSATNVGNIRDKAMIRSAPR
jgi:hypothetical protein